MRILKKLSLGILFLTMVLVTGTKELKSQDLSLTMCFESKPVMCSVPDSSVATTPIYNYGPFGVFVDSVMLYYDFGDGTDSTVWMVLTLPAGGVYTYSMSHTYTAPGIYTKTISIYYPGSIAPASSNDTVTSTVVMSPGCGTIYGKTYIDNNSNCVFDTGDDTLRYFPVYLVDSSGILTAIAISDSLGDYSMTTAAGFGYIASVTAGAFHLVNSCPASGMYGFTATAGAVNYDFGMECSPGFDATVNASATLAVPGSNLYTSLYAQNLSCTPAVSGTITLNHDALLIYASSTTPPASSTATSLTWNYSNLNLQTGAPLLNGILENITFLVNPGAMLGDTLFFVADITPVTGDVDSSNNLFSFYRIVSAPFDPNIKEVSPVGTGSFGFIPPNTTLIYTVHFQNTGTAPAIDVKVVDTLDTDLDLSTFQFVGSSHSMTASVTEGNIFTAMFDDIYLPDSTTNEPASHGWFTYKVTAKAGLSEGTPIENTAHIFFDFNPAIITNTTLNTIDIFSGIITPEKGKTNGMQLYPNPSSTNITLKLEKGINASILVIDATGKIVMTSAINGTTSTLNVEQLPSGIYQVIIPGTNALQTRFQKIK